jgi:2-polyprenyl-6-methoxyphenol hydroxylase-like FAD-dependent oxidoreductase
MNPDRAETTKIRFHVLIIGGGIGGLCLAQGLKKAGISVAVYERDQSAHFRSQGYRIHINPDGRQALRACLPDNLFNLFVATSGKPATGRFTIFDSHLHELNSRPLHYVIADSRFILSTEVNRLTLREILLAGLDDAVHFNKTLERIEQISGDQVCAHFADASSAQGGDADRRRWNGISGATPSPAKRKSFQDWIRYLRQDSAHFPSNQMDS